MSAANPSGSGVAPAASDAGTVDVPPPRSASAQDAASAADSPSPVDAPAVQDAEMTDEEYVPSSCAQSDDSSSMDEVVANGDDEVVAAAQSLSPSDSPRHRRKRRRLTASPAVPCVLVDMDTSVEEVPGHKQFKTFRGVWEDKVSWEELRSRKPSYWVIVTPPEPQSTPVLFPSQSFSASSAIPVPPASPVPSSFSSNGSVVDSVQTPTLRRSRAAQSHHPRY